MPVRLGSPDGWGELRGIQDVRREVMALTVNRRDPTIYRSGTEVDMTPPGESAAMIAVADAWVPA
jgi:hypothetical protein